MEQGAVFAKASTEHFYSLNDKFRFAEYENELLRQIGNNKASVFFFISVSGQTQAILNMAELAKAQGHKVISLTNLRDNPLAKIADIALYFYTTIEYYDKNEVTDKTPLMIIMRSLFRRYVESVTVLN